ncbi:SMI1/KNR4 family protein [Actinomadura sp. HBU206391]|uniref:SMI1/KNR4 family protein n=1 Tax=Actinomadura sp. HBU206391 TaxID=2731692 RepID=UPI00164F1A90|nr:SMI1/KNR4 family protein [Actinomadura sp. HBU206391]MBC6460374.1 SMI1/KNR4 family protein [Actinomadura sp. HBU206391]
MEFQEFEVVLQAARAERLGSDYPEEFQLFDFWRATDSDLRQAESELGVQLPEKYKEFMRRHGGGVFMFLDLLPVVSPDGRAEDLVMVNKGEFREAGFVAVSPVGTGDWWGFSLSDGVCGDTVDFLDHEDGGITPSFADFLDFLTQKGLRVDIQA